MNEPERNHVVTPNPEIAEICRKDVEALVPLTARSWFIPDGTE